MPKHTLNVALLKTIKEHILAKPNRFVNLFETSCWPEPFRGNYDAAKTPAARAKVAAKRIDHLIATGE